MSYGLNLFNFSQPGFADFNNLKPIQLNNPSFHNPFDELNQNNFNHFNDDFQAAFQPDHFDKHKNKTDYMETLFFVFFGIVCAIIAFGFAVIIFQICFAICKGQSYREYRRARQLPTVIPPPPPLTDPSPVVVTATTIPVPPAAGYPQNTIIQGYPMPQTNPGYPAQPQHQISYPPPNQTMAPYPMPQPHVEHNPPSYDQVIRGGEAYQKQAPYNPNFTG